MKVKFSKKGNIEKLIINNKNIIYPWGFESSDSAGFFSVTAKGWRCSVISKKVRSNNILNIATYHVKLPFSEWILYIKEKIIGNKIIRNHTIKCLENSEFNDVVSRFRFKSKYVEWVKLGTKKIFHRNSRLYHQHPVNSIIIKTNMGYLISIKIKKYNSDNQLQPVMYARDISKEWVIHARLFPKKPKLYQIKICKKWYNKAIPQNISNFLLKNGVIKNFLLYRAERKTPGFPINVYGLAKYKEGSTLNLVTETKIYKH